MNQADLKTKLGLNVFKEDTEFHIRIKPGMEADPRLKMAVLVCPAGLYRMNEQGVVEIASDGCLECGSCRLACGTDILEWNYPGGGTGVQYRFG